MDPKTIFLYTLPSLLVSIFAVAAAALYLVRQSRRSTEYKLDRFRSDIEQQIDLLNRQLMVTEDRFRSVNHLLLDAQKASPSLPDFAPTRKDFLETLGIRRDMPVDERLIFVLTPFHQEFAGTYNVIKQTIEELGFTCRRGDEEFQSQNILAHILQEMVRARLVIANISGRNPNVFYELGIAHALGKATLLIAQVGESMPFDIGATRVLLYSNPQELSKDLRNWFVHSLARP
jgi:hypothetical protein